MIAINPPTVVKYAPATQPVAFVDVLVQRDEGTARILLAFSLFDADKKPIAYDRSSVPVINQAQYDTFVSAKVEDGDTFDQTISRLALPIVQANFGLTGTVMPVSSLKT